MPDDIECNHKSASDNWGRSLYPLPVQLCLSGAVVIAVVAFLCGWWPLTETNFEYVFWVAAAASPDILFRCLSYVVGGRQTNRRCQRLTTLGKALAHYADNNTNGHEPGPPNTELAGLNVFVGRCYPATKACGARKYRPSAGIEPPTLASFTLDGTLLRSMDVEGCSFVILSDREVAFIPDATALDFSTPNNNPKQPNDVKVIAGARVALAGSAVRMSLTQLASVLQLDANEWRMPEVPTHAWVFSREDDAPRAVLTVLEQTDS